MHVGVGQVYEWGVAGHVSTPDFRDGGDELIGNKVLSRMAVPCRREARQLRAVDDHLRILRVDFEPSEVAERGLKYVPHCRERSLCTRPALLGDLEVKFTPLLLCEISSL